MNKTSVTTKTKYHHGDLRASLISNATKMVEESGIEGVSLRKLAEQVGVSRTAAYHHFTDKNELLCAVAAHGFIQWQKTAKTIFSGIDGTDAQKYRQFVHAYLLFATENPCLYELMFGRTIWKDNKSTTTLRDIAYPTFNYQVQMTKIWQEHGLMPQNENTLRLAQVTWGTLHGIARLIIDGVYVDTSHIEEMCDCVVNLFIKR